jgi:hypothetical protein
MKDRIFGKFFKALKEEEEVSAADIDAEVAAEVTRIKTQKMGTLDAGDVLGGGYTEGGDQVYIMDVAPIFKLIGGRGGRLAANLIETCEMVFGQHLGPKGGRCFFDGDRFFMRFAGSSEVESWNRAGTIINEIGSRILGDRFETMEVGEILMMTDVAEITKADGSLDVDRLQSVVQDGGRMPRAAPGDSDAPKWHKLVWEGEDGADWWAKAQAAGGKASAKGPRKQAPIEVLFRPTWTPTEELLGHYACRPLRRTKQGVLVGAAAFPASQEDNIGTLIEAKMAMATAEVLTAAAEDEGPKVGVVMPFRFSTLFGSDAGKVIKFLKNAPEKERRRHLIIELTDPPADVTASQIENALKWAHGFAAGVAVRISLSGAEIEPVFKAGGRFVAFDLETTGEAVQAEQISRMAQQASAARLACCLWGATTPQQIEAASMAGFVLVNGPAVAAETYDVEATRQVSRRYLPTSS